MKHNYYLSLCTADCSTALQDPNCLECRFGDNGMAICTMCRAGYRAVDGQCTNEGMTLHIKFYDILCSWINHRSYYEGTFSPSLCIKMNLYTRE